MTRPARSVVITGASTGIGAEAARYLVGQGWRVFAGVRKAADGDRLKELDSRIEPVILDVTDPDSLKRAEAEVRRALGGTRLGGLVNNAGIAMMGPLALQPLDEFKAHFEVNTFGLLATSQAFLPLLGTDGTLSGASGRIVNITSVGGRVASPFLGAYIATKHAVEGLTDTLRRELGLYGIDAIAIGPGAVQTPIWSKAEQKNEDTPYADTAWGEAMKRFSDSMLEAGREGLDPVRVAKAIESALSAEKPKARYAPVPNKFVNFWIPTHIPKRWLDKVFWSRFGTGPKS